MSLFVSSKFTPIPILLSADLSATVAGDKLEVVLRNLTEQLSAFLRRATDFLHSKYMRRTLFAFSMVSVLIGLFVFVNPVNAQGTLSDIANGMINAVSYILIEIAGIFMQITIFALKFFIEIAGYNNFIDASIVKLGWNMVRDVANMFFVVILLVIAFGTILGLEQYEWKKTLAKLIMSAFLVNFSNLICQVIIDVSQVFTITFLNAIAGAAGGNLIKMFNFDEILQIAQRGTDPSGIQIELFGGAVMTVVFAGMAMATIGAYLVVMIARMVVLWTLMIMSPLAFLFAALPNTQSHAQEFWNQFTSQVIVAPVMVFFLWLAFATFGGGDIVQQDIEENHPLIADGGIRAVTESTDVNGNSLGITFSKAASWENMANFAVAIAFLWIGLERVQKLGVVGGGLVSGAMSFGKNVATIASGVALGRWMGRKGVEGAKAGMSLAGRGLYQGLAANRVEIIKNAIDRQIEGWGDWRARGADPIFEEKRQAAGQLSEATTNKIEAQGGPKDGDEGVNKEGNKVKYDASRKGWFETDTSDKEGWKRERSKKTGEVVKAVALDKDGMPQLGPNTNNAVQKFFHGRQMALIASRKNLEKVKNQKKVREDLMDKRVTAVPKYLMQKFEGPQPDAFDRMEQGMLEAEQMRSAAKTEEFKALGKALVLNSQREKDGQRQEGGTIAQQIAAHKTNAARNEGLAQKVQTQARRDYMRDKGTDVVRATMDAKLHVESAEAESKKLEATAMTGAILASERLGDKGALAQKIAAEKAEHSETVKQGLIEKREEKRFLEGGHGQTEVREEAAFKAEMAATEAAIKRIEDQGEIDAMADVKKSGIADPFKQKIQEELEAARVAEELKEAQSGLKRGMVDIDTASPEVKATLQATEAAKIAAAGNEGKIKAAEGAAKDAAKETEKGIGGLKDSAQSNLHSSALDTRFKGVEADYAADAVAADILAAAASGVLGLVDQINLGEQAKKGADDLVKTLKNELLEKKFKQAKDALIAATKGGGGIEAIRRFSEGPGEMNKYVRAMRYSQESLATAAHQKKAQEEAEGKADELYVEMPTGGVTVPTQAAANFAKRKAAELIKLGDQGRADAVSKSLAHILLQAKNNGGEVDSHTADEAYSYILATAQGANIDDAVGSIQNKLNLLREKGKSVMMSEYGYSSEQVDGIEELRKFAEEMGIVKENAQGKYQGINNDVTQALIAQFMVSGGDTNLIRTHKNVSDYMEKNKIDDYSQGLDQYFKDSKTNKFGKYTSREAFDQAVEDRSEIMTDAQEEFRNAGVRSGHFQMVGGFIRDEKTGSIRMGTSQELEGMQNVEKSKNQDVKIAPHALGDLNTGNGHVAIKSSKFATANVSGFNNQMTFKARAQERTVRVMIGNRGTQKGVKNKSGRVVLGGSEEDLMNRGDGDLETGVLKLFNETFLPQLEHSAVSISLAANMEVGHTNRFQAEAGIIKGQIAGLSEEEGKIDGADQLIEKIQNIAAKYDGYYMKNLNGQIRLATDPIVKAQLKERKKEIVQLQKTLKEKAEKFEATIATAKSLQSKVNLRDLQEDDGATT